VTLLFSEEQLRQAEAYLEGLRQLHAGHIHVPMAAMMLRRFGQWRLFVSRVDTAVDPLIDAKARAGDTKIWPYGAKRPLPMRPLPMDDTSHFGESNSQWKELEALVPQNKSTLGFHRCQR